MQLGVCATLERLDALEGAGADYSELTVAGTVMGPGDEGEFAATRERVAAAKVPPKAYNVFLPGSLRVTGPEVDRGQLEPYVRAAFERIGQLGGSIVVFGSGRSRAVPEGFDRAAALDQLEDFLRWMPPLAAERGLTIAIEPLRSAESNVFNSVSETAAFIRERQLPEAKLLADIYHMMEEDEPLAVIDECADLLVHTHAADSGRGAPGTGTYPLREFFERLRANGYTGDCSIECNWADFDREVGPSMAFLRRTAREAGW